MSAQKRQVNPLSSKAPAINQPQSIHYYSCLLFDEKKKKLTEGPTMSLGGITCANQK